MAINCLGCHAHYDDIIHQMMEQLVDVPLWIAIPFFIGGVIITYGCVLLMSRMFAFLIFITLSKIKRKLN